MPSKFDRQLVALLSAGIVATNARCFTPPWSVEKLEACFVVIDSAGYDFRSTGLTGYNDVPSKNRTRRGCC